MDTGKQIVELVITDNNTLQKWLGKMGVDGLHDSEGRQVMELEGLVQGTTYQTFHIEPGAISALWLAGRHWVRLSGRVLITCKTLLASLAS